MKNPKIPVICETNFVYTSDKGDFDHKEIRDELEERGIDVYFDSGNVVQRIMDMGRS